MSELRWHPFRQEWVITATHRQERTFFPPDDYCPLCPTKQGGFPTEIPAADYEIAVFENKFPSLSTPPPRMAVEPIASSPVRPSGGYCEVVCYASDHNATLADLPLAQIRKLTRVWSDRYVDLSQREGVGYVYIFENKGKEIGVTLSHPHGQIYAYPYLPKPIQIRLAAEKVHYEETGRTLASDWLSEELWDGRRIVARQGDWVALVPFFARYPYEIHVAPLGEIPSMAEMSGRDLDVLAGMLRTIAGKLDRLFGFSMPYIMSVFQHPSPWSRFIVEFAPPYRTAEKLKYLAGSEFGCGAFINDTLPEETAETLRAI